MEKIYLLTFSDHDNDISRFYTKNKEWYDWIFTKDTLPLQSMVDKYRVSDNAKHYNIVSDEQAIKHLSVNINSGSFENDKALLFYSLCEEAPEYTKDLIKWLSDNNLEIEDEYTGMVY